MFHCNFALQFFLAAAPGGLSDGPPVSAPALARRLARHAQVAREPSLDAAAAVHARDIVIDRNRAQLRRVKRALRGEGVADAQFWPVAVVGSDPTDLQRRLVRDATPRGRHAGATHVGIGVARDGGRWALVALFVRRLVRVSPLPAHRSPRRLTLRGHLDIGRHLDALWMGPCRDTACQGGVIDLDIQRGRTGWVLITPPMSSPKGTYTLELMVETKRGPEPAILWQFGDDPAPVSVPRGSPMDWVADFRERAGLPALRPDPRLMLAAQRHARQVCGARMAAHVLPGGVGPVHRVRDAGYSGEVTENVAVAPTSFAAHRDLLFSPSHRRNRLDPSVEAFGLAVERAPARAGNRPLRCWVELFGR